jgi:cellobiose-specific phosphotransferase system component IIB
MKKTLMFICVAGMLTSCTVARSVQLTGQPIGTKSGEATAALVGDSSLKTAAKKGNVTTIGASEIVYKWFIIPITKTKVHGE